MRRGIYTTVVRNLGNNTFHDSSRNKCKITDNTGGKTGRVFKILGGSKRRYARLGDLVVLSVKTAEPRKPIKKKDVVRGVVVRQTKEFRRKDGSYIRFDDNAVEIVDAKKSQKRLVSLDQFHVN